MRAGSLTNRTARLVAFLVFPCIASSCGVPAPQPAAAPLVIALRADIDSWNPYTAGNDTAANVLELLYPRLLRETRFDGDESDFEPWLAESWAFSDNRLTLTFHLRTDAVWTDGNPVTCEDVRFTHGIQVADELAWPGAFLKTRIDRVDCSDAWTAVFHFSEAYPDQLLDANDDAIVPGAYGDVPLESWLETAWHERLVSCGPFRLVSVVAGQEAVLERDPSWWGAASVEIERVVLRVYPDVASATQRLLEGEVHFLDRPPPLQASEIRSREDLRLIDLPSVVYGFLAWNILEPEAYAADRRARGCAEQDGCEETERDIRRLQRNSPHPILADARVRRALTLAIDRQDLVDGVWSGFARIGGSPIVSGLWAHEPETTWPWDPEQAERLLDESGWRRKSPGGPRTRNDRPLEIRAIVNADNAVRRDVLDRVAANLKQVGVTFIPVPLPRGEFVARARNKRFDAIILGWRAGTRIEPQSMLHTDAAVDQGNNFSSWSTERSDDLMDRASSASSRAEARPLWREWQLEFRREQPLTILYEERRLIALSGSVEGPTPSPLNPYYALHEMTLNRPAR